MSKSDKIKVLYIEDDVGDRILVRKILNASNFVLNEAQSGLDGLKQALKDPPDLIIMDIDLPDIRGDELTTKIKNTPELKDVIVVALTALKDARNRTLMAGCDGFLDKPIDVQEFQHELMQFLEGKREVVDKKDEPTLRIQYQVDVIERLTGKVRELEISNRRLAKTSERLKSYNRHLEDVLSIVSALQLSANPDNFKKNLIDEIYNRFTFDRCAFIDVDSEEMTMRIKYARGMDQKYWKDYQYPFKSPYFNKLFEKVHVLLVRNLSQITDPQLLELLGKLDTEQFIFAYLGTPVQEYHSDDIRERVIPMFNSSVPTLHDQQDQEIRAISEQLAEYLTSETLYRAGFVFLDNNRSGRRISANQYRFLETLLHTSSYMYQNLSLMDQLRFLFVKAEKEAITDPLTDLHNYRYFIHQLSREISRGERHGTIFSLIMIDIDFFKNYNDAFGHQAGDLVLRRIAQSILKNTRTSDIVCRYGGEEFVIICPILSKKDAMKMAEKLRQIVESLKLPQVKAIPGGKLTISSGVATFPEDGKNAFQIILSADQALYKAKESGRNQVCITP